MDFVLGTANLGLAYGKAISRPLPRTATVDAILDQAWRRGICMLDTAAAYGEAETRIGAYCGRRPDHRFRISTKTKPVTGTNEEAVVAAVQEGLANSFRLIGASGIDQLLLHRWSHHSIAEGRLWRELRALRDKQLIGRLGVSALNAEEAALAATGSGVEIIQTASNILDWRYETRDIADRLRTAGVRIELRSVFLQGVLALPGEVRFPKTLEPYEEAAIKSFLIAAAAEYTGGDIVALCLRYVLSLDWVDAVVIGVDTVEQLDRLADIHKAGPLPRGAVARILEERPTVPAGLLDPAQWL